MELNTKSHLITNATSQQIFKGRLQHASRILDQMQFEKEASLIRSKKADFLYFERFLITSDRHGFLGHTFLLF